MKFNSERATCAVDVTRYYTTIEQLMIRRHTFAQDLSFVVTWNEQSHKNLITGHEKQLNKRVLQFRISMVKY